MNRTTNSGIWSRWAMALAVGVATAALASGCGIRPTAVPVDAGAPASRTACPSPVHPPAAMATPSPAVTYPANGASRTPAPQPTGAPSPMAAAPSPSSPFNAQPTPTPTPGTGGNLSCP
ncbi:hypothetical protein [Kitasatospora sp. NBC_01266]|uniref:hypothetical protein n=1 Tax=Kitasatospora sp. NBC_01266 TaxID=2903572 RepID=UPI002E3690A3|nr:hypothetical protein [Kitasatospora sp. NBC_01266]